MRISILASIFVLIIFVSFTVHGQERKFEYQVLSVFTKQIDQSYSESNQIGGGAGFGVYRGNKLGKFGLETSLLYLSHRDQLYGRRNTYGGLSLNGKFNFLFKTISLGERQIYIGPGFGIYQPLNSEGDYYGPSFGASAKALVPVRISNFPFYLTYDFEYITLQGYSRNSIGVSFWP